MKTGDKIKIKVHWLQYAYLGDRHPKAGFDIRDVVVIGPAKGTSYSGSDWIVYGCLDRAKYQYGIGNEQIIEVLPANKSR